MDRERASFLRAIDDMEKSLGARGVAIQMPIGVEADFQGVIDLITMKAYFYAKDGSGDSYRRCRSRPNMPMRPRDCGNSWWRPWPRLTMR